MNTPELRQSPPEVRRESSRPAYADFVDSILERLKKKYRESLPVGVAVDLEVLDLSQRAIERAFHEGFMFMVEEYNQAEVIIARRLEYWNKKHRPGGTPTTQGAGEKKIVDPGARTVAKTPIQEAGSSKSAPAGELH